MKKNLQAGETVLEIEDDQTQTAELADEQAAAETLLGVSQHVEEMQTALNASNDILVAQCEHLLSAGLASSRLPELTQARIRKQFAGRAVFLPCFGQALIDGILYDHGKAGRITEGEFRKITAGEITVTGGQQVGFADA